mgnify:CR=1 FL=1
MFLVLSGIIYILLIFVLSVKEKEVELSDFEIQRRIAAGEKRFEKILLKKQMVPIFNRLRNFASVILAVILALSNSDFLKFGEAFWLTFGLILLAFVLSRTDFMKKISHRIFEKISPKLYVAWNFLSPKNRKRILKLNKKPAWMFYSKEEMFDFLSKHKQILAERELSWFERISNLNDKKAEDFAILRENLDILHEKDLLTPLVIDELFKSKREVFVVMDEADTEVLGVVKMSKIGEISADSKRVRTVMEREFFEVRSDKNALEVFEKMTKQGESFAILTDQSGVFAGILFVKDILR